MKQIYSHTKDGKGSKLLKVHTEGVKNKALARLSHLVHFKLPSDEIKKLLEEVCNYHDLGKYTDYFQDYLLKNGEVNPTLKQHARIGSFALFEKYTQKNIELAFWAYYLIVNHHKNLSDITQTEFANQDDTKRLDFVEYIFPKQKASLLENIKQIEMELSEQNLEAYLNVPKDKLIRSQVRLFAQKQPNIQNYYLINYLFSLLIEADKLDASETEVYDRKAIPSDLVDRKYPLLENKTIDFNTCTQNELRTFVRQEVIARLDEPDFLDKRVFTLTAPTGIGKTLTALDFALKLREKIRQSENREAQIIYGLPFINIIEQSIAVYHDILEPSPEVQLLAHYQYADALEQIKNEDEEKNKGYNQALMSLDTWQADIVITSFVQLLQTLIGNRNKMLKKFNHFAGSIIILDEVQTIRLGLQPLIGASLYYLAKFLDTRILLMTATKPKIYELAEKEITAKLGEQIQATELLQSYEQVFSYFKRTKIVPQLDLLADENEFLAFFSEKWQTQKSALIVCNLVKRSVDVFSKIQAYLSENSFNNPIYYLSTNIVSAKRLDIIKDIKTDIEAGKSPILVATQVVEAGVDLDFDMGFRDLSPIDSIVQVAGRINRNNHPKKQHAPLYVINFDDCHKIYDKVTEQQAKKALANGEILEENYLTMIDAYFNNITDHSSFESSRKFFESMQTLRYDGDKKDYPVSYFKIIDEKGYAISVFVEIDDRATECREMFGKLIRKEISRQDFEKYKKDFNQRIIAVPKYLEKIKELENEKSWLITDSILWVKKEELNEYYDLVTGFNRDKEDNNITIML
jgi:CRISPR-associated endonuclease/helicase Cas3